MNPVAMAPAPEAHAPDAGPPPPPRPGPPRGRASADWLLAAAMAFAVLCSVSGLWDVIDGRGWFENAAVTVAVTLAAGAAVQSRGRHYLLALAASVASLAVVLTLQFFPTTAVLGLIPTPETLARVADQYALANAAILSQSQPVLPDTPIVFLVCVAAGLAALIMQVLVAGLRFPAAAAVPLAIVLAAASLLKTNGAGLLHVGLTAVGFLAVLGAARLAHQATDPGAALRTGVVRQAAAIAAGALALMLVVPLGIPGFTSGIMPQGQRLYLFGKPSGVNPVLNLGSNLRDRLGLTNVTYYTDSQDPVYLRTAVISDLDARRWEPSDTGADRDFSTRDLMPDGNRGPGETTTVHTRVVTGNYQSPWLPMPRDAVGVTGLDPAWGWNPDTQTMFSPVRATSLNLDYTVTAEVPVIDAARLEESSDRMASYPGSFELAVPETYSRVPDELPVIITETARQMVDDANADTAYEEAVALQDGLRGPEFTYSEQTPLEQGYDGNGLGVIEAFLQQKSGYCIHYSSAMALMARTLGIPSRIAVGYAPGRTNGKKVPGTEGGTWSGYELSARSAHAWPELYFAGVGWVPFEPTPGRGSTPSYATQEFDTGPASSSAADDEPRRSAGAPATEESEEPSSSSGAAAPAAGGGSDTGWGVPAGAGLVVLVALFGPLGVRRLARARRRARIRRADPAGSGWRDAPLAAWEELVALGFDYGLGLGGTETASDYAARLAAQVPAAAPALDRLRGNYELATYSSERAPARQLVPRGPSVGIHRPAAVREVPLGEALLEALTEVERDLSDAATPGRQFLARAWPASLWRR